MNLVAQVDPALLKGLAFAIAGVAFWVGGVALAAYLWKRIRGEEIF